MILVNHIPEEYAMTKETFNSFTATPARDFTIVSNFLIRTPTLSTEAKALLNIGLSHSGNWHFSKKQVSTCFKEKMHTVDKAMKELRELGYLHLLATNDSLGKMTGYSWFWYYEPVSEEEFKKSLRNHEIPGAGQNRHPVEQGALRRTILKKTKYKEEEEKEYSSNSQSSPKLGAKFEDFYFDKEKIKFVGIKQEDLDTWKKIYPYTNIEIEIAKAEDWLKANTSKSNKKKWRKFLITWFQKNNDQAENKAAYRANSTQNKQTSRASTNLNLAQQAVYDNIGF